MLKTRLAPAQRAAMYIALKAGALKQCVRHWVYFRSRKVDSQVHAYRLGNYLISHFAKSVKTFKGDRKRMADAINTCLNEAPVCCLQCAEQC
jgi:hypothetical protein